MRDGRVGGHRRGRPRYSHNAGSAGVVEGIISAIDYYRYKIFTVMLMGTVLITNIVVEGSTISTSVPGDC
jgi:hypothetical protein